MWQPATEQHYEKTNRYGSMICTFTYNNHNVTTRCAACASPLPSPPLPLSLLSLSPFSRGTSRKQKQKNKNEKHNKQRKIKRKLVATVRANPCGTTEKLKPRSIGGSLAQTERLLASPAGHHHRPQQLKRPTADVANGRAHLSSSRDQDEPRGGGGGSVSKDVKDSNRMAPAEQQNNGRAEFAVYASRGGPTGASMADLTKSNRKLTLKVKVCKYTTYS